MSVVTRFAPSPTGMLHIGGARTALFNYLFAKRHGGKYLLRIEDTDIKRNSDEAINAILNGLKWIGVKHDGDPVYQSHNADKHKDIAYRLLENGSAFECYVSQEELIANRETARSNGNTFVFRSPWRDKNSMIPPTGVSPVIRIRAPDSGSVSVFDYVHGNGKVPASALDDMIILRADSTPVYMLAVVVDDHDMGVTHVIRGAEHYSNAFRQAMIYNAMNWNVPQFCHVPLILGSDGIKLSKRHGASSITEYRDIGYLPEALRNYLVRLGWSHGNDEIISDKKAIEWFSLENIGKSPARFDFVKLGSLNSHYIREKSDKDLYDYIISDLEKEYDCPSDTLFMDKIMKAMGMIKDRATTMNDIVYACGVYMNGFKREFSEDVSKIIKDYAINMLSIFLPILSDITIWNAESLKELLKNKADSEDWKMKKWTVALRIAITFDKISPGGIFEIMEIIGKDECLSRVNDIIGNRS